MATNYVIHGHIERNHWEQLFGYSNELGGPFAVRFLRTTPASSLSEDAWQKSVRDTITGLISEETFQHVLTGGPFGKEGQVYLARQRPTAGFLIGETTLLDTIPKRQQLWEDCRPWTTGLATLFDATQEELFLQGRSLSQDGRLAEASFTSLRKVEKIAFQHLVSVDRSRESRTFGDQIWRRLLLALDEENISLDYELHGRSLDVLRAVRKKGHQVDKWIQCYNTKLSASVASGKRHNLKREVTHFLHNAAKKAAYQREKVWGRPERDNLP